MKIARGKVKEDEKYTCPICDWRVKIPRDAARPKLEDLIDWQAEIANLPFQPEEEALLSKIIDNAQDFRNHVAPFCNPIMATSEEAETQRFYLRKIEGAEVLLVKETNYFRKQLHKWSPVADEEPPVIEGSKSTRKPRPTKLQKLMAQHGVDDPELLPANLRTKQHTFKRKSSEPQNASGGHSRSHSLLPAGVSVINNKPNPLLHRPHENRLGGMGADMRLGYAPGMRQMGADGLFDRYSAHASPHLNNPYLGNNSATPERERWALDQHHTHMMPQGNMFGSTVDPSLDPSLGRNVSGLSAGQDGGIEKMFTDLTNADGVDAEREEAVRRAEGGAPDEEGAKEEGEDGGGQAGEMLGLYGEREEDDREGGREPGWF